VDFASIPAACLAGTEKRVPGTPQDAQSAMRLEVQRHYGGGTGEGRWYQGPTGQAIGYGAGYYLCEFGGKGSGVAEDPTRGLAAITFTAGGPATSRQVVFRDELAILA
jgi:hypothetical protein